MTRGVVTSVRCMRAVIDWKTVLPKLLEQRRPECGQGEKIYSNRVERPRLVAPEGEHCSQRFESCGCHVRRNSP